MYSSLFYKELFTFQSFSSEKLRHQRPLYPENSPSVRQGIIKGRFNGLKKIAGHMRSPHPHPHTLCFSFPGVLTDTCVANNHVIPLPVVYYNREHNSDKSSPFFYSFGHFLEQMYHSYHSFKIFVL